MEKGYKMKDMFTTIPMDKLTHGLGDATGTYTTTLLLMLHYPVKTSILISIVLWTAISAWKEWYWDARHPDAHTVDVKDFYAGLIGIAFSSVVLLLTK